MLLFKVALSASVLGLIRWPIFVMKLTKKRKACKGVHDFQAHGHQADYITLTEVYSHDAKQPEELVWTIRVYFRSPHKVAAMALPCPLPANASLNGNLP
jgi:hypothetical protein